MTPHLSLPNDDRTFGAWFPEEDNDGGDLHVYVNKGAVVLGRNKTHGAGLKFTDPAIVIERDVVRLQTADASGNVTSRDISPHEFATRFRDFIESFQ